MRYYCECFEKEAKWADTHPLNKWTKVKEKVPNWKGIDEPRIVVVKGLYDMFLAYCCKDNNNHLESQTYKNIIWVNTNNNQSIRDIRVEDCWIEILGL